MKSQNISAKSNSLLHDHIIDGTTGSYHGAKNGHLLGHFSKEEYVAILEKIIERLEQRVHDFRIKEGLIEIYKRTLSIFFACLFAWLQINGDDLDMRRSSRSTRTARQIRSQRNGRRRAEEV